MINIKHRVKSIMQKLGMITVSEKENWHEDMVVHIASVLKPKVYVELGLYQCEVFNRVSKIAEKSIGVDIDPLASRYMNVRSDTTFIGKPTAEARVDVAEMVADLGIDMLFIDADHSAEAVMSDFENYFPLINENGLILLHDAYPRDGKMVHKDYCGDGYKAIFELSKQRDEFELVTIPIHPGLAICRKRTRQLAW